VFVAVCIVVLVLVQQGKGATMGAAFGSGASQTVFGSRGSGSFLFRITMAFAAVFFITSITLNHMATSAYKQVKVITFPAETTPVKAPMPMIPANVAPVNNIPATAPATSAPTNAPVTTPQPGDIPIKK
jgi:preprotein translocase subunit SecG